MLNSLFNYARTSPSIKITSSNILSLFQNTAQSASGVYVTEDVAKSITAYWRSVMLLSQTAASLPIRVYRKKAEGKKEMDDSKLSYLLTTKPNKFQTAYDFWQYRWQSIFFRGAAYARIVRNKNFDIEALVPIHPDAIEPFWTTSGTIAFRYNYGDGKRILMADEVFWDIPFEKYGFTPEYDITPVSPLRYHAETLGTAYAVRSHGANTFKNGAKPSGVLKGDAVLEDQQFERLKKSWADQYEGTANSGKTIILESGFDYKPISMTNDDAQYIEQKQMDVEDISRIFGIPLPMLNSHEKSTSWGSGIHEMVQGFVKFSLHPWLTMEQASMHQALFGSDKKYLIEYDLDHLLKGDPSKRGQLHEHLYNTNAITPNEIREMEGRNPIEGGDRVKSDIEATSASERTEEGESDAESEETE